MHAPSETFPMARHPSNPIHAGTFRRFGAHGPVYKILRPVGRRNERGEDLYEIEVPESGERAEYSAARILADPEAR